MPVSPSRQAELRAKRRDVKEFPRKRCVNCPKFFLQRAVNKRFCSDQCRKEFFRYGSAFAPLKEKLEAMVTKWMKDYAAKVELRLKALEVEMDTHNHD